MACISAPTALLAGGALSAGTSLIGGINASSAATSAAKVQAAAATQAAQLQGAEFQAIQGSLAPFRTVGTQALGNLQALIGVGDGTGGSIGNPLLGPLTAPISTTSGISETCGIA